MAFSRRLGRGGWSLLCPLGWGAAWWAFEVSLPVGVGFDGGGVAVLVIGGGAIADAGFAVAFSDERRRWSSSCFSPTLSSMLK